jgi:phage tail P2-like protein
MGGPRRDRHLLPDNATPLERALSASDHRLLSLPSRLIRAVWSIDDCPERLLPYLAHAWSLDEWDVSWTEAQKRQAIRDSVWLHAHKGTVGAMKRALRQIGYAVSLREWFQYPGRALWRRPYTFRLYVPLDGATAWTADKLIRLRRVAVSAKNVRSLLEAIVLQRRAPVAPVRIGAAVGRTTLRLVNPPVGAIRTAPAGVFMGAAVRGRSKTRLPDIGGY